LPGLNYFFKKTIPVSATAIIENGYEIYGIKLYYNPKSNTMAKYSKGAGKKVERAMHEMHEGSLKSGRSGKKVKSRKQAIAIGLSEARKEGAKVPKKGGAKKGGAKKAGAKKGGAKKGGAKKSAGKKSGAKKGAKKGARKSTSSGRSASRSRR
jgi:hypothetical protein